MKYLLDSNESILIKKIMFSTTTANKPTPGIVVVLNNMIIQDLDQLRILPSILPAL